MATSTPTAASPSDAVADDAMTAVQKLREQADAVVQRIQPQIAAVSTYARDEPTKALLISAAAGAALMGLVALMVRSGNRSTTDATVSAGRSAMAAIRDAALDLADSAQSMAAEALESAQKRVADVVGSTQKRAADSVGSSRKRAAEGAESLTDAATDAWNKVREQAGPMVDKIKPQIDAAAAYAKDEPIRAALGLAAVGAVVAGLVALSRQSSADDFDLR